MRLLALLLLLLVARLDALPQSGQALAAPPPRTPLPSPLPHPVLDRILAAQAIACGVSKEEEDYSRAEDHGNRAAFDIDLCKAVAVAVLGPGAKLILKSFPDEPASTRALRTGEIDVVASASPTVANTADGLLFTSPVLYDGQGMLTLNRAEYRSPTDLAGKKICFLTSSGAEEGLHAYAADHKISYVWYPFSEAGEMEAAFFTGNCDAISSDVTQLANIRTIDPRRANDFKVLPQIMRQDPLAMATLGSDARLASIVNWTVETLVMAEQLGVTMAAAKLPLATDARRDVRELLGQRFGSGTALGLDPRWGANVIAAVGNYGELFQRDLGADSSSKLDRGENRLWTQGGLMYGILPAVH